MCIDDAHSFLGSHEQGVHTRLFVAEAIVAQGQNSPPSPNRVGSLDFRLLTNGGTSV